MKKLNRALKTRIPQAVLLLAVLALVTAFAGAKRHGDAFKLGGTWAGRAPGQFGDVTWIATTSADPSGRYATTTQEWITNGDFDIAALAEVGATKASLASGYTRMTGRKTGVSKATWYLAGPSDEPNFGLDEIKAIAVMTGEFHFTGPDTTEGTSHLKIYETLGDPSMVPTENMRLYLDIPDIPSVNNRIL